MSETPEILPPEPRSWGSPVKVDPILTDDPTPAELGRGINQLHACLEDSKRRQDRRMGKIERNSARTAARVGEISEALGLGEDKPKNVRTVATQTRRAAFWRTVGATFLGLTGAITAAGVTIRLTIAIWPSLKAMAVAVGHALATGKL